MATRDLRTLLPGLVYPVMQAPLAGVQVAALALDAAPASPSAAIALLRERSEPRSRSEHSLPWSGRGGGRTDA